METSVKNYINKLRVWVSSNNLAPRLIFGLGAFSMFGVLLSFELFEYGLDNYIESPFLRWLESDMILAYFFTGLFIIFSILSAICFEELDDRLDNSVLIGRVFDFLGDNVVEPVFNRMKPLSSRVKTVLRFLRSKVIKSKPLKSKLSDEESEKFLKKLHRNFGMDEMYYSQGGITCCATKNAVVVIMEQRSYSSMIGSGGTEMKSGIYLFNPTFEKIDQLWLKPWRHQMNADLDDWSRRLYEIVSIKEVGRFVVVECTTGVKGYNNVLKLRKENE